MNKTQIIAAIELGSSKITTLIGQIQKDEVGGKEKISIMGVSSVDSKGIKKGQIINIEEAVEATNQSVEGAERMAGFSIDKAFIALNGASVFSQNSHGVVAVSNPEGEINEGDIDRVIEAASAVSIPSSREIIHVLPREYTVDGEKGVRDPVGMSGIRLEVETHIVTASLASIKNVRKAVNEVGISIDSLVFTGLAAADAALSDTEKELGCVLVDIGGGVTSIAAYCDGSIAYTGVIPIGAKNVTSDLAIGLKVSLETAEKIKLSISNKSRVEKENSIGEDSDTFDLKEEGVTELRKISRKTVVEGIIRPRLVEIFTMVKLELDKVGLTHRIPTGVIITGGGAKVVGAMESAKRSLSLPVRIGVPRYIEGLVDDLFDPQFAVPVGLLIYALKNKVDYSSGKENIMGKFKLPTKGILAKLIDIIKNILP
jgi:cell division protein FtsA